jgi:UDP-N-acetylglucosamine--N-acetylmuramyl-(pentapeptide) pyrophosphoryl-undecaprenol N-acetylglucosamine transferase
MTVEMMTSKLSRVLFAGGGTGGHVFMAVALAEELRRRDPATQLLFVGTRQGLEARVLGPLGFELQTIEIGGLNQVGFRRAVGTLLRLPLSILKGRRIVKEFKPSIIVGVGGYSSGPVVLGGRLAGYRSLIIEPNAYPGLTNRLLARWTDGAAVAFQEACEHFGSKARLIGIPIRKEFHELREEVRDEGALRVLVFGGSQGSKPINTLLCEAIRSIPADRIRLVHQTGKADHERVRGIYDQIGFQAEVTEFIHEMPGMFAWADLIIARSGASTVAEVTAAGKPAILIPFPEAADNHQRRNAEALARRKAALMLEQGATSGAELAHVILKLAEDRNELRRMAAASRRQGRPDSVERILDFMGELAGSRKQHGQPGMTAGQI